MILKLAAHMRVNIMKRLRTERVDLASLAYPATDMTLTLGFLAMARLSRVLSL